MSASGSAANPADERWRASRLTADDAVQTARMDARLAAKTNRARSAAGVATRYGDLLDGYIVDHADADGIGDVGARVTIAKTLMKSLKDRETLAHVTLDAADALASRR